MIYACCVLFVLCHAKYVARVIDTVKRKDKCTWDGSATNPNTLYSVKLFVPYSKLSLLFSFNNSILGLERAYTDKDL